MSEQQVEQIVDRVRTQLGALEHTLDGLRTVQGSAKNVDGSIVAYVDGRGALTCLELAESVTRRDAVELGSEILATAHEAARRAGAERARLLQDLRSALA
ncbi:YbaB/EbfC family DNA-binding protein [Rhodococcus sp. HNM0563]|uniref:YbaB/EbfC family DNA-binding protein n=1 Tax=unclassified Rhodococcus (in: high G+C Gram-positive bacteria) TaxID=192944 RepID=UPI00146A2982|nr:MULTISPECIES: YbaB/EbfC family DNA-binding protein [unclassified Rhodococcus (in: high G+C Gram-positive bacteria)]MCK0093359.1 YbaB/EbfC family DNA-binding protein [Rhodococcus sp. F64268]NLU60761.1 YbaB/EbfC family DNA-binding protein [Rhodococcus sp. HNM0563]